PEEIGYLRSLAYLQLGENSLDGYIPSSLGNLSNLFSMYLNNNQRCGSIPEEIGYLSSLTYLYLVLMMQQQIAIVPLQHQTVAMTQHYEGDIQVQEAQNQEDIADVPQLQLQVHICVSSKCNQVIHQIKMLLSVQFHKEQFLHQWKNIGYVTFASTDEATALLKWKATFKNQNNSLLASWMPSFNACTDWYGVICFNGRVNTLNITNSSVIGTLYAFPFSSLPFLENLDLSMNNFSGTIPPEIGNITNLLFLNLNINQFSGTIPQQIGSLAKLQTLRIFYNHLNGSIPEEIGYLRSLTKLSLCRNFLTGSIPASLGNLSNLSILLLYNNQLSGSIPASLGNLTHYHDYGVLMQQQVANMTQSQQQLQHEALMQQHKAIVPLQHQTAAMTQHNEGEIQEQEAQNQEDIADVPQLQLQVHICVSSKCNQVIHQIKMLLSVQFPKEQFFHQWKNIGYGPYFRDKN
ncbi:hypothetical protein H5410_029688, partial [Solanum commersonii]